MRRFGFVARAALALTLGLAASTTAWAQGERRVALVIGNAAYKEQPLLNPVNDARAMTARLKQLGFDVVTRENATRAHVASAIAEFAAKITPSTVALFYYAGHGIQVRGRNFLIPLDAEIESESSVPFAAIDVAQINDAIEQTGARAKVMVLDACRNNPFERKRGVGLGRGLAPIDAARGSLVAFATAPGSVAADGDGVNSVYTGALLKALAQPGLKAEEVFKQARLTVLEQTRGQQTPWEQSALVGELILNPIVAPPPVAAAAQPDRETVFWQSVQTSNRIDEYEAYLRQYPQGAFASLALSRIQALRMQPLMVAAPMAAPMPAPWVSPWASQQPAVMAPSPAPAPAPASPAPLPTSPPERTFRDCSNCPEMVVIPAGSFLMGSPPGEAGHSDSEGPQHMVSVRSFAAGKFEVTFAEWEACVAGGGCSHRMEDKVWDSGWGRGNRPVINVSWDDAKQYVAWLARRTGKPYRLLSEAEWEYAARAGTTTAFSTGATISQDQANFAVDGKGVYHEQTVNVGSFPPNRFGLHDMHGNVWEWVEDCYNPSFVDAPVNGSAWATGDCTKRVVRGGSWSNFPGGVRSAFRSKSATSTRYNNFGFRVARTE